MVNEGYFYVGGIIAIIIIVCIIYMVILIMQHRREQQTEQQRWREQQRQKEQQIEISYQQNVEPYTQNGFPAQFQLKRDHVLINQNEIYNRTTDKTRSLRKFTIITVEEINIYHRARISSPFNGWWLSVDKDTMITMAEAANEERGKKVKELYLQLFCVLNLPHSFNKAEYSKLFVENGYDTYNKMKSLSEDECIKIIGIQFGAVDYQCIMEKIKENDIYIAAATKHNKKIQTERNKQFNKKMEEVGKMNIHIVENYTINQRDINKFYEDADGLRMICICDICGKQFEYPLGKMLYAAHRGLHRKNGDISYMS